VVDLTFTDHSKSLKYISSSSSNHEVRSICDLFQPHVYICLVVSLNVCIGLLLLAGR
jgi:hypothetical protein